MSEPQQPTDWRKAYREATAAPHPAVKKRVWKNLQAPPRSAKTLVFAFVASATTAALLVFLLWPKARTSSELHDGFALASNKARYELKGDHLELESGRLTVSAWKTPVVVQARSTRVDVTSAIAVIEVAAETVTVRNIEGIISIDGVRQIARPEHRLESRGLTALRALEPPEASLLRAEFSAELAGAEHRWRDATDALSLVSSSGSLRAEAALLKRGEIEFRQLNDPKSALASFDEGDRRFPKGALAMERALSALEALVALGTWETVVTRSDAFLAAFPSSNRVEEVRRARTAALRALERMP